MAMKYKKTILYILFVHFLWFLSIPVFAQSEVINNVRSSLRTGSSKELIKYFNHSVELNFDGNKSSYSRTQAEFVLRDFFRQYPPTDFQYIHHGASPQGFRYAIGKYTYNNGTFRVWILFKHADGKFYADTIDFTKDN
jgi:hypothetical protein